MSSPCNFSSLLCKVGIHSMEDSGHWCDKDCSVIFAEQICTRCGKEAWEWVHWDPDMTRVMRKIPAEIVNAALSAVTECAKVQCELATKTFKEIGQQETAEERSSTEEAAPKKKRSRPSKRKAESGISEEVQAEVAS